MAKSATKIRSKTIAYLRVSTVDQVTEKNKNEILKFANDKDFGKGETKRTSVTFGYLVWFLLIDYHASLSPDSCPLASPSTYCS